MSCSVHSHRYDALTVPRTVLYITPSNYKHDPYTVLLALSWQLVSRRPGFEFYQSLQLFSNLISAVTLIAAHLQASFLYL